MGNVFDHSVRYIVCKTKLHNFEVQQLVLIP